MDTRARSKPQDHGEFLSNYDLIHGECLAEMAKLPDASVDMVMCDLPYGTTQNKWDSVIPFEGLWAQYKRVCKGVVVLTASQPFTSLLVMSNLDDFRYAWVWDKVNRYTGFLNAKRCPLKRHEDVLVFRKGSYNEQVIMKPRMSGGPARSNGASYGPSTPRPGNKRTKEDVPHHPHTLISIPAIGSGEPKGLHPTQKPVQLMEYLIKTYTDEGMTVLDNCMGSGTTGVACMNTGRNFIGIERDEKYFAIAKKRIEDVAGVIPEMDPFFDDIPIIQTCSLFSQITP